MIDKNLSKAFDLLRFPLAVLVIYLHIDTVTDSSVIQATDLSQGNGILLYHSVSYIICLIARCAVPCFFLISGYLLVINTPEVSLKTYIAKIKKRFYTLLIPYVLWNILAATYLQFIVKENIVWQTILINPADFPLWFLRNLIILNLIYPIFLIFSKYGKSYVLVGMTILYLIQIPIGITNEFTAISIYYFYLGIYLGYNNFSFSKIPKFIICGLLICCLISLSIQILYWENLWPVGKQTFLLFGVLSLIAIAYLIAQKSKFTSTSILASGSFFIYASHKLGPTFIAKASLSFLSDNYHTRTIVFLVAPLITASICLIVYIVAKRFCPKLLHIFTGGK